MRVVQQAREARLRELELERERKAALMEHLFTHGTRGEPTKHTEIGEIPESWDINLLNDVVRCSIKDGTHKTPIYITEEGIPFITAKDIIDEKNKFGRMFVYIKRGA